MLLLLLLLLSQYGEWLPANRERLSAEDYSRYCHQLEIMRTMCQEFERETGEGGEGGERGASGGGGDEGSKLKNERIFELMQQVRFMFDLREFVEFFFSCRSMGSHHQRSWEMR